MSQMTASMLCADHTFKIPANIGVWKNGTWLKLYDGLFMVLNEIGVVTAWQLTKGTKFEAIQDLLIRLKSRMDRKETKVEMFCIDNCCQWRNLLNEIFPDTQIKLYILHALQRIVSKIPKRKGTSMQQCLLRNQLLKSLRLILREPCDSGEKRLKETPSPTVILTNIQNFRKQWASVKCEGKLIFPEAAESALNNLEVHVDNGCLSYIPKDVQPFNINTSDPISDAIDAFETHPSILKIKSTLVSPNDSFDFQETSLEEVVLEITILKSTCAVGPDKIPAKILKLCTLECAPFLVNCFNNTKKTSNFPSEFSK